MKRLLIGAALAIVCATGAFAKPVYSTSLAGLPGPLVAKVKEIQRACGSKVTSTYRSNSRTNHGLWKAADLQGNPRCIYAKLKGWPGGYSIDYHRAPNGKHVHISYNPRREWGLRFAHRHYGKTRYASRRVQYAAAHPKERD